MNLWAVNEALTSAKIINHVKSYTLDLKENSHGKTSMLLHNLSKGKPIDWDKTPPSPTQSAAHQYLISKQIHRFMVTIT